MKYEYLYILFFLLISCTSDNSKSVVINNMHNEVKYLSSDELKGRQTGTEYEIKSARYIASLFDKYNLEPKGDSGFFQNFQAKIRSNPHTNTVEKEIKGLNVVGYRNNSKEQTIIIGAHYDHLGLGEYGSLYDGGSEVHNGADDNASGVSLMLNLIDGLRKITDYNYLFIAFSGEEHGLYGSSYYAKNSTINLADVKFMLNFDMVGRLDAERRLVINGVGTSDKWRGLIDQSNYLPFDLKLFESGTGGSDHTSFYLQDIPVLHFFTGQHEDYHKPSDDYEKINFQGMYEIFCFTKDIILNSVSVDNFDFQETVSDTNTAPRFTVTLGIMPDYLFDEGGLRIDGVTKGKVASKYNILKGDIITKMGDVEVIDIMTYMKALSKFKSGDRTDVEVLRSDEKIKINIVFE